MISCLVRFGVEFLAWRLSKRELRFDVKHSKAPDENNHSSTQICGHSRSDCGEKEIDSSAGGSGGTEEEHLFSISVL
jgi:hypothetical protein